MKNKKPKKMRPPYQGPPKIKSAPAQTVIFKMDAEQFDLIRKELDAIYCAILISGSGAGGNMRRHAALKSEKSAKGYLSDYFFDEHKKEEAAKRDWEPIEDDEAHY